MVAAEKLEIHHSKPNTQTNKQEELCKAAKKYTIFSGCEQKYTDFLQGKQASLAKQDHLSISS